MRPLGDTGHGYRSDFDGQLLGPLLGPLICGNEFRGLLGRARRLLPIGLGSTSLVLHRGKVMIWCPLKPYRGSNHGLRSIP